jgi:hypothetical protein
MGHFRRQYQVSATDVTRISIPFNKEHIGDVLASLSVFGNVKYVTPPTFTPNKTEKSLLQMNLSQAMKTLLVSLSGSEVKVTLTSGRNIMGSILGLDTVAKVFDNTRVDIDYLVLSTKTGSLTRCALTDIDCLDFPNETVKAEIENLLQNNSKKIKPYSTFLDIDLLAQNVDVEATSEEAMVQYTVPVAAWKMRYSIRQLNGRFVLDGTAIIDNNTDEDWDNFTVSVVTGNPISFATDLADVTMPTRSYVPLVDASAQGNITVSDRLETLGGVKSLTPMAMQARKLGAVNMANVSYSTSNRGGFGLEDAEEADYEACAAYTAPAEAIGVDSKDVGDFCIFTAKEPISIPAKRSVVVQMFTVPLVSAGSLLSYLPSKHTTRSWRTIKFKNESNYSLGKGKVVIYQDGEFQGECVLEAAKPNENRLLPHCLENGVSFRTEVSGHEHKQTSLKIAKGVVVSENVESCVTNYVVYNKKNEQFNVSIEHNHVIQKSTLSFSGATIKETEVIGNNRRIYFTLEPNQSMTIEVKEEKVHSQRISLGSFDWLNYNVIDLKHPLADNSDIKECALIQERITGFEEKIESLENRVTALIKQCDRVRSNITAVKDSASPAKWIDDLSECENEIRLIEGEKIPQLEKEKEDVDNLLRAKLAALTISWTT